MSAAHSALRIGRPVRVWGPYRVRRTLADGHAIVGEVDDGSMFLSAGFGAISDVFYKPTTLPKSRRCSLKRRPGRPLRRASPEADDLKYP